MHFKCAHSFESIRFHSIHSVIIMTHKLWRHYQNHFSLMTPLLVRMKNLRFMIFQKISIHKKFKSKNASYLTSGDLEWQKVNLWINMISNNFSKWKKWTCTWPQKLISRCWMFYVPKTFDTRDPPTAQSAFSDCRSLGTGSNLPIKETNGSKAISLVSFNHFRSDFRSDFRFDIYPGSYGCVNFIF